MEEILSKMKNEICLNIREGLEKKKYISSEELEGIIFDVMERYFDLDRVERDDKLGVFRVWWWIFGTPNMYVVASFGFKNRKVDSGIYSFSEEKSESAFRKYAETLMERTKKLLPYRKTDL